MSARARLVVRRRHALHRQNDGVHREGARFAHSREIFPARDPKAVGNWVCCALSPSTPPFPRCGLFVRVTLYQCGMLSSDTMLAQHRATQFDGAYLKRRNKTPQDVASRLLLDGASRTSRTADHFASV